MGLLQVRTRSEVVYEGKANTCGCGMAKLDRPSIKATYRQFPVGNKIGCDEAEAEPVRCNAPLALIRKSALLVGRTAMPRKVIIGVIGATHRDGEPVAPEVLDLARSIGHEIGTRDAILLTGGEPNEEDRSVKSFAMLGCQEAQLAEGPSGRMISVLSERPSNRVDPAPGTRRIVLQTKLSSMGRNPLTGGTPDRLIVLRHGRAGTLVELAFALRWNDPVAPVFVRSIEHLRQANTTQQKEKDKILAGIREAIAEFRADGTCGIPQIDPATVRDALSQCLNTAQDTAQGSVAIAKVAVDAAMVGVPDQLKITRFEGLPCTVDKCERVLNDEFEKFVDELSDLQPGAVF
jgi:hypothetical protein